MIGSCFIHLPGVKMDLIKNNALGPGYLKFLSFEDWQQLDKTFSGCKSNYQKSNPLFFVYSFDKEGITKEMAMEHFDVLINLLSWSFTLTREQLPSLHMSCSYFLLNQGIHSEPVPKIGGFQREWLVFGDHYSTVFNNENLEDVRKTFDFLIRAKDFESSFLIMNALSTLAFTSNPEFCYKWDHLSYFNSFVYWVATLEGILMPEEVGECKKLSLAEIFGRNLSVMLSDSFEKISEDIPYNSEIYRIRSLIMHGEAHSNRYTNNVADLFRITRYNLCTVIKKLIVLNNNNSDCTILPSLLLKASYDENAFNDFHSKFQTQI